MKNSGYGPLASSKVIEQWATALAAICNLGCECRQKWEDGFERGFNSNIALLQAANEQVSAFIHATEIAGVSRPAFSTDSLKRSGR